MKRIVIALAVASLFNATHALADNSPFPGEAPEFIGLSAQMTYADRAGEKMPVVSAFPGEASEFIGVASQWTYADRSDKVAVTDVYPGSAPEIIVLESKSPANERNLLARSASDPALSE